MWRRAVESSFPSLLVTFTWDAGAGSAHEEAGTAPTSGTAAPGVVWSVQAGAEEVVPV